MTSPTTSDVAPATASEPFQFRIRDLSQMAATINAQHGQGINSGHRHGAQVGMADGAVRFLRDSIPADVLRSWINLDDGTLPEPAAP